MLQRSITSQHQTTVGFRPTSGRSCVKASPSIAATRPRSWSVHLLVVVSAAACRGQCCTRRHGCCAVQKNTVVDALYGHALPHMYMYLRPCMPKYARDCFHVCLNEWLVCCRNQKRADCPCSWATRQSARCWATSKSWARATTPSERSTPRRSCTR